MDDLQTKLAARKCGAYFVLGAHPCLTSFGANSEALFFRQHNAHSLIDPIDPCGQSGDPVASSGAAAVTIACIMAMKRF
jgi:hypothetical protein